MIAFFAHIILLFPYWLWPIVTILALFAFLSTNFGIAIPGVAASAYLIRMVSITAMVVGVFFSGAAWIDSINQVEIKKAEQKVAIAEARADQLNKDLNESRKKFLDLSSKKDAQIHKNIRDQASLLDKECRVPRAAITILNEAAK